MERYSIPAHQFRCGMLAEDCHSRCILSPSCRPCRSRKLYPLTRPALESASIILRSNIDERSNNVIQKGLAFGRDWSGAVANSERVRTLRDPGGFVGAARCRFNRTEDLDVKVNKEALSSAGAQGHATAGVGL